MLAAKWLQGTSASPPKTWLRQELGALLWRGRSWHCRRSTDLRLANGVWRRLWVSSANRWKFTDHDAGRMILLGLLYRTLDALRLLKPVRPDPTSAPPPAV